jgi:hypothetical protein
MPTLLIPYHAGEDEEKRETTDNTDNTDQEEKW